MGKYTQGVHWIALAALSPVLSVKASLVKNLLTLPTQKSPQASRKKDQKCFIFGFVNPTFGVSCEAGGCRLGCQESWWYRQVATWRTWET